MTTPSTTADDAPYFFVPVAAVPNRTPGRRTWERLDPESLVGKLRLTYECVEPVHLGTGALLLAEGKIVKETMLSTGEPIVPGSSLKGSIRSRFEAITRSCVSSLPARVGRPVRVLSRSRPDVKEAVLSPAAVRDQVYRRCDGRDGLLCPSCGLWGFQSGQEGRRGRVSVLDMTCESPTRLTVETMPQLFGPRLHHLGVVPNVGWENGRDVFVVKALAGRKFAKNQANPLPRPQRVQAIPRGTHLSCEVRFFNLTHAELGGLLRAAGVKPVSMLKVGAAKGHGFGAIRPLASTANPVVLRTGIGRNLTTDAFCAAFESSADFWKEGAEALEGIR